MHIKNKAAHFFSPKGGVQKHKLLITWAAEASFSFIQDLKLTWRQKPTLKQLNKNNYNKERVCTLVSCL